MKVKVCIEDGEPVIYNDINFIIDVKSFIIPDKKISVLLKTEHGARPTISKATITKEDGKIMAEFDILRCYIDRYPNMAYVGNANSIDVYKGNSIIYKKYTAIFIELSKTQNESKTIKRISEQI